MIVRPHCGQFKYHWLGAAADLSSVVTTLGRSLGPMSSRTECAQPLPAPLPVRTPARAARRSPRASHPAQAHRHRPRADRTARPSQGSRPRRQAVSMKPRIALASADTSTAGNPAREPMSDSTDHATPITGQYTDEPARSVQPGAHPSSTRPHRTPLTQSTPSARLSVAHHASRRLGTGWQRYTQGYCSLGLPARSPSPAQATPARERAQRSPL